MIRRLAKPIAVVLALACASVATQYAGFLEAVTSATLADLLGGRSLTEGDKTFSNFSYTPQVVSDPVGALTLLDAGDITVTASTTAGGLIMLSVPLGMSATLPAGGPSGDTFGVAELNFSVTVSSGSDVISGVTLSASGAQNGTLAVAGVDVDFSDGSFSSVVAGSTSDSTSFSGLGTLGVAARGTVATGSTGETAEVDEVVFIFEQSTTPSAPVPEPGSLALVVAGVGMVLARGLYRRCV